MDQMIKLEERVAQIERRNKAVEADKAWESSNTRRILLIFFTYSTMAIYMRYVLGVEPFVNAIVPTLGFLLSTLTLSFIKNYWMRFVYKKNG